MDKPERLTVSDVEDRVTGVHNLAQAGDPEAAHGAEEDQYDVQRRAPHPQHQDQEER